MLAKINGKTFNQYKNSISAPFCRCEHGDGLQLVKCFEQGDSDNIWLVAVDSKLNFRQFNEDLVELLFETICAAFGQKDDDEIQCLDDTEIELDEPRPYAVNSAYFLGYCYRPIVNFGIGKQIDFTKHIEPGQLTNSAKVIERCAKRHNIEKWCVAEQLSYFLNEAFDKYELNGTAQKQGEQNGEELLPIVNMMYIETFILWQQK